MPVDKKGNTESKGRIAPFTKDGGKRVHSRMGKEGFVNEKRIKIDSSTPTVAQIKSDRITDFAQKYWSPFSNKLEKYEADIIENIYKVDLQGDLRSVVILEFSQYLECYLWPNFNAESSSKAHIMSIIIMINEKFRERVPPWIPFQKSPDKFPVFFNKVMNLALSSEICKVSISEQVEILIFLNHCFTSMEIDLIRDRVQRLVSLSIWISVMETRRNKELNAIPKWKKFWKAIQKRDAKTTESKEELLMERTFLRELINRYFSILHQISSDNLDENKNLISYCERFIIFMTDLEALLPTRRFFNLVLDDSKLLTTSKLSYLYRSPNGKLFNELLDQLNFYVRFEISDETGDQLSTNQTMAIHYDKITSLQLATFSKFPEMRQLCLSTVASIDNRENLYNIFENLDRKTLYNIAEYLFLVPPVKEDDSFQDIFTKEFLVEMLISKHEKRESHSMKLNEMPLYPTENVIWDENVVPGEFYNGDSVLALPKLNLQFLTLHDYLYRNFKLFQLESTYEIRGDIEDSITRLKPWTGDEGEVIFGGWARMALPIITFSVVEVAKPNIGEKQPSRVRADVSVNLSVKDAVKSEWEGLRKHDVCFLVTVRPPIHNQEKNRHFVETYGIMSVRGCEIEGILDENGRVMEEGIIEKPIFKGDNRTFRVKLDTNQYHEDMESIALENKQDVYETFNVLIRRKPKENNFKAVLETIRELMNTQCVVPEFLHDIILGYGDPRSAHYSNMPNQIRNVNFSDTFLSLKHLISSFPQNEVILPKDDPKDLVPPFKITFQDFGENEKQKIHVESFKVMNRGPYSYNFPKKNAIQFTPTQVEAIKSGVNPGLTMVVGPPGTGKTDVAVQIINLLYHNFPEQRTLIVTHSNQALNQLFEKIMALDIDERHLLRLGHGEEALETEKDFSRYGRVNYVLNKRLELLNEVGRLQSSLNVHGDLAYTCETAGYFFLYHVLSRWEIFCQSVLDSKESVSIGDIGEKFPFKNFFSDAPQPLFKCTSFEEDKEIAFGCWTCIQDIFTQLEEFRAFELLRSGLDRTRYLCVKEAKIIAMTCTHAALKRKELAEIGFKYDNILMEESAQILEIETFIPLLLQNPQDNHNRLKRWIMIGDHHQLPPVIKNAAFQKFSNMEQSLFTRLVRLGVPTIELDAQGRARPSLCSLYNWRYKSLGNLHHVLENNEYLNANGGFSFDYQLINVADFQGVGESQPSPFFYQNLAEAEYVVATFMYMRLLGYPAEKISILTTYNGQKHLIRDVVNSRCAKNSMVGVPYKITTVDKYQGQQNDFILLSLVRTKNVGHLRDVRRLIVAMSRAKLGLYVFARVGLFKNCFELQPAFNILTKRPLQLHLCPDEVYQTKRQANVNAPNPLIINDMTQMCKFVYDFYSDKMSSLVDLKKSENTAPTKKEEKHVVEKSKQDDEKIDKKK
ncbi:RNA helicase aquarius [Lepeophtheirus salmonis]|uniref:RNA helicase aquarius n=1 Tax=Lepeophtheirus salmonis TaxID=72036 RepID=UPI001AE2120E|nr:RNA helicase aquarius-like [Lepeophtheirus salmonis]